MLLKYENDITVKAALDSVKSGIKWFKENPPPDLVFLDIQLSDGTAFDLLRELNQSPPIIFTTAYDQYAVKAFKFNSVDYLLKPLNQDELNRALDKFIRSVSEDKVQSAGQVYNKIDNFLNGDFKKRFLVKVGKQFRSIEVSNVAYFIYDDGFTYICDKAGKRLPIDHSLDNLENMLHPLEFFRVNRKLLVALSSINQIHTYFNGRLLLKLNPAMIEEVVVSRDRVSDFKRWMDV